MYAQSSLLLAWAVLPFCAHPVFFLQAEEKVKELAMAQQEVQSLQEQNALQELVLSQRTEEVRLYNTQACHFAPSGYFTSRKLFGTRVQGQPASIDWTPVYRWFSGGTLFLFRFRHYEVV